VLILQLAGVDASVAATTTVPRAGVADRPRNGVLARPRADALGLPALRPWPDALADYLDQAGLGVD
jgi:dTDP-4-dehydrorhamnose reductase